MRYLYICETCKHLHCINQHIYNRIIKLIDELEYIKSFNIENIDEFLTCILKCCSSPSIKHVITSPI